VEPHPSRHRRAPVATSEIPKLTYPKSPTPAVPTPKSRPGLVPSLRSSDNRVGYTHRGHTQTGSRHFFTCGVEVGTLPNKLSKKALTSISPLKMCPRFGTSHRGLPCYFVRITDRNRQLRASVATQEHFSAPSPPKHAPNASTLPCTASRYQPS
jgi:hypothetical protein